MKFLIVINLHSFIDVITNSSTELFVCDTDKTVEMVKEILIADPNVYGYEEPWVFNINEYREWRKQRKIAEEDNNKYWEEHGKPSHIMDKFWDSPFSNIEGWFYDTEDEDDMEYLRKSYIEDGPRTGGYWNSDNNIYKGRLSKAEDKATLITKLSINIKNHLRVRYDAKTAEIQKIYDEIKAQDEKPDWWVNPHKYHYNEQPTDDLDGKIIIMGEGDNSMPYDHFDWIERTFNATRHHLG